MVKWSATRLDIANYCIMRYYLRYIKKEESLRLAAYVKGSLLHNIIEHFWERSGKTPDEVKSNSKENKKKKYYDVDSFVNFVQGRWKRAVIGDKNGPNKIHWRDETEPWQILNTLPKICRPLYYQLLNEGPPLFSELQFDFILQGQEFSGFIDEVRVNDGEILIRDYKSGWPFIGDMKVDFGPQLTIYNVGLCSLCFSDKEFARRLGISEEKRKTFMGNPLFVNPDFEQEFFMIEALSYEPKIGKPRPKACYRTKRENRHFSEIIDMINSTQKAVSSGDVYFEWGRKCDMCDMKLACRRESEKIIHNQDKNGQFIFDFDLPAYARQKTEKQGPKGSLVTVPTKPKDKTNVKKQQGRLNLRYKNSPHQCGPKSD